MYRNPTMIEITARHQMSERVADAAERRLARTVSGRPGRRRSRRR